MGDKSSIQWTDATWNPTIGCTRVSEGCRNCYAFALHDQRHESWKGTGAFANVPQYHKPFSELQVMGEDRLLQPTRWKRSRRIFVNSMSDLFHKDVPLDALRKIVGIMGLCAHHRFQVFTKRPERMREFLLEHWPEPLPNVLWGVSVEDERTALERIPLLLESPAIRRAVSYEPALEGVSFESWLRWEPGEQIHEPGGGSYTTERPPAHPFLDWIIVGGESGSGARPFHYEWALSVAQECREASVPLFVKQMGSNAYRGGKPWNLSGKGGDMQAWPHEIRVREHVE